MDTPSLESEALFGRLLTEQGLATPAAVEECLRLQAELAAMGVRPVPKLGDLLIRRGFVTASLGNGGSLPPPNGEAKPSDDLPPDVAELAADPRNLFGKYVRSRALGSGGMGAVWKAWDRVLHRWIALKFLATDDPKNLARFKLEAWAVAQINHPNIVAVHDVGELEGQSFIAMQYVEGQTLAEIPRSDPKRMVEIVRDAALAVHAAHARGIIHRDLKPDNIMVGTDGRVYVMDFGLAKTIDRVSSISGEGTAVGTPAFMSPEQALGQSEMVTARCDVYSLGATLYFLLTGGPPILDNNVFELLRKIVQHDPAPVRRKNPAIDRDLEAIVMRCLEKDPERRYATARGLARDLTRYLEGSLPPQKSTAVRKRSAAWTAVALLAAAALSLGGWALARAVRRDPAPPPPPDAELLRRAAERDEELAALYFSWGKARNENSDVEGALRAFTRALELSPRDAEIYLHRGLARKYLKDLAGAETDFSRALEINPRYADAYNCRAGIHVDRREYDEAVRDFSQAIELNPRDPKAHSNRGYVRRMRGEIESAVADFSRAVDLAPTEPNYLANRARARATLASRVSPPNRELLEAAAADCERAQAAAPPNWPYRAENQSTLEGIRAMLAKASGP